MAAISAPVCSCRRTGHPVECGAERDDLVFRPVGNGDASREIALFDPARRIDQILDRAKQAVGQLEGREDGQRNDEQRAGQQRAIEGQLVATAALKQFAIIREHPVGPGNLVAEILAGLLGDEQIGPVGIGQRGQDRDPPAGQHFGGIGRPAQLGQCLGNARRVDQAVIIVDATQDGDLAIDAEA